MRDAALKGAKLLLFLVGIPFFLTWSHLHFILQRNDILLVENLPSFSDTYRSVSTPSGVYWNPLPASALDGGATYLRQNSFVRRKIFGFFPAWPSISQLSSFLLESNMDSKHPHYKLEFLTKYNAYCFSSADYTLCPTTKDGREHFAPPKVATWKIVATKTTGKVDESTAVTLRIRSFSWFKQSYYNKEEKPFQQLFQRPATCLLLALNVVLAFCYWNFRVSPNAVALMDGPMLQQFQYWRGLTGALAHFEWWHLLFNMMSLHNLGQFLEEDHYGSINFLLYNLGLIPVTVLFFFAGSHLVYSIRHRLRSGNNNESGINSLQTTISRPAINAVGYSGILFAWMVISALEQTKSCPIPFLDSVCFETWHLTEHIKFNLGPMIQLVVAQVILPRVSFGGHLAGIVAGFWLHWNVLPLEIIQPSVSIPLITLVQWKVRQFLPVHSTKSSGNVLGATISSSPLNFLDEAGIAEDENDSNDQESVRENRRDSIASGPFSKYRWRLCLSSKGNNRTTNLLATIQVAMVALLGTSLLLLGWGSSILYSQALLFIQFHYCRQSYADYSYNDGDDNWSPEAAQKKERMLVFWKGYITCSVIVVVMESMTLAGWTLMGGAMFGQSSLSMALLLLAGLLAVHGTALSVACRHWEDIGGSNEGKGIFEYSLGFCVLDNAKEVGRQVISCWSSEKRSHKTTFPSIPSGSGGIALGRASSSSASSNALSDRKALAAAAAERRARLAPKEESV